MLKIKSYWFGRFSVNKDKLHFVFKDLLAATSKILSNDIANEKNFPEFSDDIDYFLHGFLYENIDGIALYKSNPFFKQSRDIIWQFPALTERFAHLKQNQPMKSSKAEICAYFIFPWATIIDIDLIKTLYPLKIFISGYFGALSELGFSLKLHTVCQHIFWERCIPIWKEIGLTDVWLSHMPSYVDPDLPFKIHPWALYAVNVEDPNRKEGIEIGKDPASKSLLASFIGAHSEGYISDIRLRLRQFSEEPGFLIRVTDKWHFEDVVYKHQVQGLPLEENYVIDDSVREYNDVLSDSVFALCPSGAGPNSIRLWEALAVGSIPVLLGKFPVLPRGGSLPEIDWDSIVLKISDDQLSQLPQILRSMSMDEIRARQKRGIDAYALVREQRCF